MRSLPLSSRIMYGVPRILPQIFKVSLPEKPRVGLNPLCRTSSHLSLDPLFEEDVCNKVKVLFLINYLLLPEQLHRGKDRRGCTKVVDGKKLSGKKGFAAMSCNDLKNPSLGEG